MDNSREIISMLKKIDAIITDSHFVYTSGKHGSVYVRKDKLYPHTQMISDACLMLARDVRDLGTEVVVGPSICGIVMSQWTAYHLSNLTGKEVLSVFTEKIYDEKQVFDRPQVFKRGYDQLVKGKRVLVVEDLTTTGGSVRKVVDEVNAAGGNVVMVYVLVNRNPDGVGQSLMGAPFRSLSVVKAEAFDPGECTLCKKGIPINTQVGHGQEFLVKKG